MFCAYLRGFIRPGYPVGRQSRIRELVLCRALDREQQGDSLISAAQANLELLAGMPVKSSAELMQLHNEAMRMMSLGHDLRQQYSPKEISKDLAAVNTKPLEQMADVLKALKVSNLKAMLPID